MADDRNASGTDVREGTPWGVRNRASWILVGACCVLFVVYLALHTRELRLIGEWLASG